MKKLLIAMCVGLTALASVATYAGNKVGVVDMQTIFKSAPQVKQINLQLQQQFKSRKNDIMQMGQSLQADIKKYQKNKSVMSSKQLTKLQNKITANEVKLRSAQQQFQKDLFQAQNKQMTTFMNKVRGIVKAIAANQDLSMVLPKNSVLYSDNNLDITSQVVSKLK